MTKLEQLYQYKKDTEALGFSVPKEVLDQIKEEEEKEVFGGILPYIHHELNSVVAKVKSKLFFSADYDPEREPKLVVQGARSLEEWFDGKIISQYDASEGSPFDNPVEEDVKDLLELSEVQELDSNDESGQMHFEFSDVSSEKSTQKAKKGVSKYLVSIVRPDGSRIENKQVSEVLIKFITEVGAERIAALNVKHNNSNLLSLGRRGKDNIAQEHPVGGGYYVNTHSNTECKVQQMKKIIHGLNLVGWKLEYKDKKKGGTFTCFDDPNKRIIAPRTNLRVYLPGGHVIENSRAVDTMVEVIKYVGPRKVQSMGWKLCGLPFISDELSDNPRYLPSQKAVGDGLYAFIYNTTEDKKEMIETLSQKYDLNLRVEIFNVVVND